MLEIEGGPGVQCARESSGDAGQPRAVDPVLVVVDAVVGVAGALGPSGRMPQPPRANRSPGKSQVEMRRPSRFSVT
jgi:hypothetical protein